MDGDPDVNKPTAIESNVDDGLDSALRIRVATASGEQQLDWPRLLDAIPNIVAVYDAGLRLRHLNKAGRDLFGLELNELVGRRDLELIGQGVTSKYWPLLEKAAATRQVTSSEQPTLLPGRTRGEELLRSTTYAPILGEDGELLAIVGITNSLFAERDPTGALTAGIASGIADDLGTVFGVLHSSLRFVAEGPVAPQQQSALASSLEAAERGSALADRLAALIETASQEPLAVDLTESTRATLALIRGTFGDTTGVSLSLSASPLHVRGKSGQVERILLNLLLNAREALPIAGKLAVSVGGAVVGMGHGLHGQIPDGGYALLCVSYTDTGQPPRSGIGAPLGTETRSTSELGFLLIKEAVRELGGVLRIENEKGWNTTATVYLPLVTGSSEAPQPERSDTDIVELAPDFSASIRPLRPHVLVVDEDQGLRDSLVQVLIANGLEATGVTSGAEAVQLLRTRSFDVVVTEQLIGNMDGTQLIEQVRDFFPGTASILLTSHAAPDIVVAAVNRGRAVKILLKNMSPITIRDEITSIAFEALRKR
jgi:CheY-like chemotaxis protein/signal transduction histidine kinase